jgi:hypothetical protein
MSSDELQQKLINAKGQREQHSTQPTDPRELAERKKYHALYNRIYPMLLKSTFDFAEVADVAGLKQRRMRDALLFRMALGEVVQLFGHKPGSCYLCGTSIRGFYRQEPFCIFCLRSIDVAISSLYPTEAELKLAAPKSSKQKNHKKQPTVSILDDLLACGVPLMAVTGDPVHTRPEVLKILDQAEEDADIFDELDALLKSDRPIKIKVSAKTNLRRFGFQRVKPRD